MQRSSKSEVTRFATQRTFQLLTDLEVSRRSIYLYPEWQKNQATTFFRALLDASIQADALSKIKKLAARYIWSRCGINDSLEYKGNFVQKTLNHIKEQFDLNIPTYAQQFYYHKDQYLDYHSIYLLALNIIAWIENIPGAVTVNGQVVPINRKVKNLILLDRFKKNRETLGDALIAISIDTDRTHHQADYLVQIIRFMGILERVAEYEPETITPNTWNVNDKESINAYIRKHHPDFADILNGVVVLPKELFPLKQFNAPPKPQIKTTNNHQEENLKNQLLRLNSVVEELKALHVSMKRDNLENPPEKDAAPKSNIIDSEVFKKLTPATQQTLLEEEIPFIEKPLPTVIEITGAIISKIRVKLHKRPTWDRTVFHKGSTITFKGTEPNQENDATSTDEVKMDDIGLGHFLGVADLMIVEQNIKRYEMGEIAHVENVLKGEYKERLHRVASILEEEVTTETEQTKSTEKDQQSTDRFELKNEAAKTVKEDHKVDVGLSVSYDGAMVKSTLNSNYSYANSKENSNKTATNYAKELIQRSKSKIEERVKEVKVRMTREEFEEKNTHGFDNKTGDRHVIGVYCFLDKIYELQVVNYGKRSLLEFIVPEPAAFYLKAISQKEAIEKPDPPMVDKDSNDGLPVAANCDNATGLKPSNIDKDNYEVWCNTYQVNDPVLPPKEEICFYHTKKITKEEGKDYFEFLDEIIVPEGYDILWEYIDDPVPGDEQKIRKIPSIYNNARYFIYDNDKNFTFLTDLGTIANRGELDFETSDKSSHKLFSHFYLNQCHEIYFYNKNMVDETFKEFPNINSYDNKIPIFHFIKNPIKELYFQSYIKAKLKDEKREEWKQSVFNQIINNYQIQLYDYERKLAASQSEEERIKGNPPQMNRQVEQNELKRNIISLIQEENFGGFDSIVDVNGFPEINFLGEVRGNNKVTQFLEQAFEWHNMTYIFYPYFWGRKGTNSAQWMNMLTQVKDTDPLFEEFLKAGAARVVVPVRHNYEAALMFYAENKQPWNGQEPPTVDDPLYVSMVTEILEEHGINFEKTTGTLRVTKGSDMVTGEDTNFIKTGSFNDIDKEIVIEGDSYRILDVVNAVQLQLDAPYRGKTNPKARYNVGAKYVGQPWEVKVPTTLIMLQDGSSLPDWGTDSSSTDGTQDDNGDENGQGSGLFEKIGACLRTLRDRILSFFKSKS